MFLQLDMRNRVDYANDKSGRYGVPLSNLQKPGDGGGGGTSFPTRLRARPVKADLSLH